MPAFTPDFDVRWLVRLPSHDGKYFQFRLLQILLPSYPAKETLGRYIMTITGVTFAYCFDIKNSSTRPRSDDTRPAPGLNPECTSATNVDFW